MNRLHGGVQWFECSCTRENTISLCRGCEITQFRVSANLLPTSCWNNQFAIALLALGRVLPGLSRTRLPWLCHIIPSFGYTYLGFWRETSHLKWNVFDCRLSHADPKTIVQSINHRWVHRTYNTSASRNGWPSSFNLTTATMNPVATCPCFRLAETE
jgi:hypothetical protein